MIHIILSVRLGPWQVQLGRRWPASEMTVWQWQRGPLRVLKWKPEGDDTEKAVAHCNRKSAIPHEERVLQHYETMRRYLESRGVRDDVTRPRHDARHRS
jgi:hypothetical protein